MKSHVTCQRTPQKTKTKREREKGEKSVTQNWKLKIEIEIEINWESQQQQQQQQWNKYRVINMLAKSKTVAFLLLSCLPWLPLLLCIFVWPGLESRRAQAGGEELSPCPAPAPATGALEAQAQPACAIAWPNFPSRAKRLSYSFDFGVGVGFGFGFGVFQTVSSTIWQSLLRYTSVDMRYDWLQYSISSLLPPIRRGVSLPAICNGGSGAPPIESFAPFWRI